MAHKPVGWYPVSTKTARLSLPLPQIRSMRRSRYLRHLLHSLPSGVELYLFDPQGLVHRITRGCMERLDPTHDHAARHQFHRFIDDGQFTRYFVGHATTSDANPTNATAKLGIVRPHSAFTPHAHGAEHFVLSLGYASCGLYDVHEDRVVDVRLFPGTLLHIPPLVPHSFNNRATDPLLLLVTNTGMGVDHADYAITAAQAEERAGDMSAVVDHDLHHTSQSGATAGAERVDYLRLAAALRRLEREMPDAPMHRGMTWREQIAQRLRRLAWLLEGGGCAPREDE